MHALTTCPRVPSRSLSHSLLPIHSLLASPPPSPSPLLVLAFLSSQGVECDANKKVIAVRLPDFQLAGKLTDNLAALNDLTALVLNSNPLQGQVPPSIAKLTNLQVMMC